MPFLVSGQEIGADKLLIASRLVASEYLLGPVCVAGFLSVPTDQAEEQGKTARRRLTIQLVSLEMLSSGIDLIAVWKVAAELARRSSPARSLVCAWACDRGAAACVRCRYLLLGVLLVLARYLHRSGPAGTWYGLVVRCSIAVSCSNVKAAGSCNAKMVIMVPMPTHTKGPRDSGATVTNARGIGPRHDGTGLCH